MSNTLKIETSPKANIIHKLNKKFNLSLIGNHTMKNSINMSTL
jgi:hypothetical protein